MVKQLAKSIREYKKESIATPILVAMEVVMECIIPFIISMVQGELLWMVLCPAVIVLHCAFYLFHMYRWSKKL